MAALLTGIMYASDFTDMREKITDTELTDLQRKKIIESYIGKKVVWQGWIFDVKEENGKYICMVDMDSPDTLFSVPEFQFTIDEDLALKLKKGQVVYVTGVIKAISSGLLFRVTLEDQKMTTQKPVTKQVNQEKSH
jgi:hypothetical protein